MNDTVEINTPENLRKDKFRRKVCIGCAFYCRDRKVYKLIDGQLKHNDTGYIFRRVEDKE